jgi:hypothetical protein
MTPRQFESAWAALNAANSVVEAKRVATKAIAARDLDPDPKSCSRLNALQARAQLRIAELSTVEEWIADYEAGE